MVIDELAKFALVIPAEPDKLALVKLVIVLDPASIVLFISVWVTVLPTTVSEVAGKAKVVPSVPLNDRELETVNVLPLTIVKVPVEAVTVNPL